MLFEIDWLTRETGSAADQASFAELQLSVGDLVLTKVYDTLAKTVRPSARVSVLALGRWFASNWWRLRWEPQPQGGEPRGDEPHRSDLDWRLSHEMSAAGEGFLWPPVTLASDGEFVRVSARHQESERELVRYLSDCAEWVPSRDFERAIDGLMEGLLARLSTAATKADADDLFTLWDEVNVERKDPNLTALRRREALLGLDPDQVELPALGEHEAWMGTAALDEVLAASNSNTFSTQLDGLQTQSTQGVPSDAKELERLAPSMRLALPPGALPWQRGSALAQALRSRLGLDPVASLPTETLSALLGRDLSAAADTAGPFSAGFRQKDDLWRLRLAFRKTRPTSRRFEVARLIGDALIAPASDQVLPITVAGTARQKTQRAFAQELLCPVEGLRDLAGWPDYDEVASRAEHYEVSEQMVVSTLVNKKLVSREALLLVT